MAALYARKILMKEINPETGIEWTIDDVPGFWRAEVEDLISEVHEVEG